jgi:hypothetical protein
MNGIRQKNRIACQVAGRIARAGPSVYQFIATPLWADDGTNRCPPFDLDWRH